MNDIIATPLQRDVPCVRCGYDLRGLTPPGKCPECGFDLEESIRAASAAGFIPPPQPRWLRAMLAGAACTLTSFAISTIATTLFDESTRTRIPAAVLASTFVIWALALYGCWALAWLEALEAQWRWHLVLSRSLRFTAVAHVALSMYAVWTMDATSIWSLPLLLTSITLLLAFYLRLRHVAIRLGRPGLGGQALMIAVLAPTFPIAVARSWSSYLLNMPPVGGWPGILRFFTMFDSWRDLEDWGAFVTWPFLFTICQVAVLTQLLMTLVRARRRVGAVEG